MSSKEQVSQQCKQAVSQDQPINSTWADLQRSIEPLSSLLVTFQAQSKEKSKLFCFWSDYMDMVVLLLQFIKSERTGYWSAHLSTTSAMVPHFFSMDRVNYAGWLPVYLSDMHSLESKHPEVYQEFMAGNHSVSHSQQPFAQVWTDMALEQSVNLDSKSKGGIVGLSTKEEAVERWFLTSHERTAISQALKRMCGQIIVTVSGHTKKLQNQELLEMNQTSRN